MKYKIIIALILLAINVCYASSFRVDADIKSYDDYVADLNAAFDSNSADPMNPSWVKLKLNHMVEVDQYARELKQKNRNFKQQCGRE